jgi:hypothetical protein
MNFLAQSVLQQNFPSVDGSKTYGPIPVKTNNPKKEPLKCWVAEKSISRETVHTDNRIVEKFITFRKLPQSMMWQGVCRRFMQHWIITKLTTKLQWWK